MLEDRVVGMTSWNSLQSKQVSFGAIRLKERNENDTSLTVHNFDASNLFYYICRQ